MPINQSVGLSRPLYEQIQIDLIRKIESGLFVDHQRIPSENELCREYGVSRITATKALTELALNGYIYRLQGKGSFVVPAADRPVSDVRKTQAEPCQVGFVIPASLDYHTAGLVRGVSGIFSFPQFIVNVIRSDSAEAEEYILQYFYRNRFDGVLIFPNDFEYYNNTILQMHLNQYPFVLVDRMFQQLNCPYVTCDNAEASKLAVEYLRRCGHNKIGFAAATSFREQAASIRYQAYAQTVRQLGMPVLAYENLFSNPRQTGYLDELLNDITAGKATALLVSSSGCAVQLHQFFQQHQIRVPDDVSIICFDNPCLYSSSTNFFTYIDQDSYQMGAEAGKILRYLITKEGEAPSLHSVFRPKLVECNSVRKL